MSRALLLPFALLLSAAAGAGTLVPAAGKNYRVLEPRVATELPAGKVQVIEFFSIGCPHCAEFEPHLQAWLKRKPANVEVVRLPAIFNPFFKLMGRAYYALEDCGAAEAVSPVLMDLIHVKRDPALLRALGEWQNASNRNDLEGAAAAEKLVAAAIAEVAKQRAGVDPKKFIAAWNSFSVNARLSRADAVFRRYGVRGVPTIAVDGRFVATVGRDTGIRDFPMLIEVIDHLIGIATQAPAPASR